MNVLVKEWLLVAAAAALAGTCFYAGKLPSLSREEWQVLVMLYALFAAIKGLESNGLFAWLSWRVEQGRAISLKLVFTTFFLSMVVTNDVALIVMVPVALAVNVLRKDLLVILEALAANAGSALTPVGNPQNLFLYWHYHVPLSHFMAAIAPLTLVFFVLLAGWSALLQQVCPKEALPNPGLPHRRVILFSGLLVLMVLVVLHILPVLISAIVIIAAAMWDRRALGVDYALLIIFFCFFGVAQNLQQFFLPRLQGPHQVFLWSAFASQVVSNVPAAILFSKSTAQWKALLWGSNVGGFGSLVGSLANLIAYRLYVIHKSKKNVLRFTMKFLAAEYAAFLLSLMIFLVWFK